MNQEIVTKTEQILDSYQLCDPCLGRLFGKLGYAMTDEERGAGLRVALALMQNREIVPKLDPDLCELCSGLFNQVTRWGERIWEKAREYEFESFLIGNNLPPGLEEKQKEIVDRFQLGEAEDPGHHFNRETGKALTKYARRDRREIDVDFELPEVTFFVDLEEEKLKLQIRSLYIYGRYRKLVRGIPQTKWPCKRCGGSGCSYCDYTGKIYPTSVEELIAAPFLEAAGAEEPILHGAGREDVDAKALGEGRPFVLELTRPRRRKLDLSRLGEQLEREEDRVGVSALRFVNGRAVAAIKEARPDKSYRVEVKVGSDLEEERLRNVLKELKGEIYQRTPHRVAHRRADKVRVRRVKEVRGKKLAPAKFQLEILCEGGLYVKELISSDGGRTKPSLAAKLGREAEVTKLDVLGIEAGLKEVEGEGYVLE